MIRYTKLSELAKRKGKLLSPLVDQLGDVLTLTSWSIDRLPEYLWLALILNSYSRTDGINCCVNILKKIHAIDPNFDSAKLSYILSKDDSTRSELFDIITSEVDSTVLAPLTSVIDYDYDCLFYKRFYIPGLEYNKRISDLKYIAIIPKILSGRIHLPNDSPTVDAVLHYGNTAHDEEIMRIYRPAIRSLEGVIDLPNEQVNEWVSHFWNVTARVTACKLFSIHSPSACRSAAFTSETQYPCSVSASISPCSSASADIFCTAAPASPRRG